MPRTPARRPPRLVPLAEGSAYSKLSIKTLRRYGVAGRITLYRAGVKLIQVDLDELDRITQRIPTADGR
jgi:hypothetical protein